MHDWEQSARLVRPYAITGGRSGEDLPSIELEALISVTAEGLRNLAKFRWEAAQIIEITKQPTALIELAGLLDVPLGVVRVLVADLSSRGVVEIIDPPTGTPTDVDELSYTSLLQKVLDGIKAL